MQKSKKITILIIILILLYGIITSINLVKLGRLYTYVLNPIIWIAMAIFLKSTLGKMYENRKLRKSIIEYSLIAALIYIIVNLLAGLFVTFGKNPYATNIKGLIINLWITGSVIIAKEYIRYRLINNVYDKDKFKIGILIVVAFSIVDFGIGNLLNRIITPYYIFVTISSQIMPIVMKNVLYTYIAMNSTYLAAASYEMFTRLFMWLTPIFPNSPWIMTAIIETVIPLILFLYIRYEKNKKDKFRTKEKLMNLDPRNIVPLTVLVILAIFFAIGLFPIKPIAIASGSMMPEIYVGDVVLIKKCELNDIEVGDIIEYQMEGFTVIHRVVEIQQKNGEFYFITKGDNNDDIDSKPVTEEQLIGKCIFKVRYLGYPAIWLHIIQQQDAML